MLQDRIEQLTQLSQQAHPLDYGTQQRLDAERRACQMALDQRLQRDRQYAQQVLDTHGDDLQGQVHGWLEDRLASYGHCLDHHHDDSALPPNHIFTDMHVGPSGGRLFRSRSDETLSASDHSGKGRKQQFYESRKAAMEQIRGWKVPVKGKDSASRRRERGRSTENLHKRGEARGGREQGRGNLAGSAGNMVTVAAEVHRSSDRLEDRGGTQHDGHEGGDAPARQNGQGGRHTPNSAGPSIRSAQLYPPRPQAGQAGPNHSQTQVWQAGSHGNLSSPHSENPYASTTARSSQNSPRRSILRGRAEDPSVHERSRSSTRVQTAYNDRSRVYSPVPNGRGSPSVDHTGGRVGAAGGAYSQYHTAGGVQGTTQSFHAHGRDGGDGSQRFRARTRSIDNVLDDMENASGERRRSRSEERVLESENSGGHRSNRVAEDRSGYVTDFATGQSYVNQAYRGYTQYGQRSQNANSQVVTNTRVTSERNDINGRRFVLSSKGDQTRMVSNERTPSVPNFERQDRQSGRGPDADDRRHGQGPNTSLYTTGAQQRQQQDQPQWDNTRPSFPSSGSRTAFDRSRPLSSGGHGTLPSAGDAGGFGNTSRSDGVSPYSQSHDVYNQYRQQRDGSSDVLRQPNSARSDSVPFVDKRISRPADGPREQPDRPSQWSTDRPVHTGPNPPYNQSQLDLLRSGSPNPYQPRANEVSHNAGRPESRSEGNVSRQGETSSHGESQPVPSGHYSVTNGCLRHESFSYGPVYNEGSKEDSTCSSNQDSGYGSRMVGQGKGYVGRGGGGGGGGRSADSTTPSSSFSTDRSLSAGTPSNASSPYMHLGGNSFTDYTPAAGSASLDLLPSQDSDAHRIHQRQRGSSTAPQPDQHRETGPRSGADFRPGPSSTQQQQHPARGSGTTPGGQGGGREAVIQRQVQGWYQRKLLEAAQRLRNSEQYGPAADDHVAYNGGGASTSTTIRIPYDPVHGSDV